jgi:Domain of unknown function (DUF4267)
VAAPMTRDVRAFSFVSAAGRIAIGVGMLAAPEPSLRALGFSEVGPATAAVGRIAGVRDLVLGLVTLSALDDRAQLRTASLANAVADAGDAAVFAVALRSGERAAGVRGVAAALPAAAAGVWVSWRLS